MAHSDFQLALSQQDSLLRSKSRIRWLSDGDRNTSLLHNMIKIRRLHIPLVSLRVWQIIFHDRDIIADQVVQHFHKAFTRDPSIVNTGLVERIIPRLVTDEKNLLLSTMPTAEEITKTVKMMDEYVSAPGPDGFSGSSFHHCWEVVFGDVISAV